MVNRNLRDKIIASQSKRLRNVIEEGDERNTTEQETDGQIDDLVVGITE